MVIEVMKMESTIYPNVIPIQNKQLSFDNKPSSLGGGATLDLDQYSTHPKMIILSIVSEGWGDVNQDMYIDAIVPIPHNGKEEVAATVPGYLINVVSEVSVNTFKISYDDQENKLTICLSNPQPPHSFKDVIANAVIIE